MFQWVRAIQRINSLIGKVEIFAHNELKLDDTMRKIAKSKGQSEASEQTHILKQTLSKMIDIFMEKQSYIVYILVEKVCKIDICLVNMLNVQIIT